jgi:[ribosomal protein S18]-alanine N-acetyltransferase
MRATCEIRFAKESDYPQIVEIERLSFGDRPWNAAAFRRLTCGVAELENRIIGFVAWRTLVPRSDSEQGESEILNVAVHPEFRGHGIGRALMKFCMRPGGTYYLEVRESNTKSRKLYESLGFIEVGTRPDYYENPRETAIVMKRK